MTSVSSHLRAARVFALVSFAAGAAAALALSGCGEAGASPRDTAGVGAGSPAIELGDGCCERAELRLSPASAPTAAPGTGVDHFFVFPGVAAPGQRAVVSAAPGDADYHGGRWRVFEVRFNGTPTRLRTQAEILAAERARFVTITRVADRDFACPLEARRAGP